MKIVVLAGGISTERDVSLISAQGICRALRNNGHQVIFLDVFLGLPGVKEPLEKLWDNSADEENAISDIGVMDPDIEKIKALRGGNPDCFFGENVIELCKQADMVYMGLHGADGENGKVQAAFDTLGIRYTGSGYLGSAVAMDKGIAKTLFMQAGVPGAKGVVLHRKDRDSVLVDLAYPLVVKPCCGGSSVGVSIVCKEEELKDALDKAFFYEEQVVIEEYIKGREFSAGVIDGKALPIIEIIPKEGFYDYETKYQAGMAKDVCPAPLDEEKTRQMQTYAVMVYEALHLESYARIDFLMDAQGQLFCLEANTLPGMTPTSLLPQEAAVIGLDYGELCEQVIALALEKYEKTERTRNEGLLYTLADRVKTGKKKRISLNPEKIAEICQGKLFGPVSEEEIQMVTLDSRQVKKGDLFIATKGERVDGNRFVPMAYEAGAACCMSENAPDASEKLAGAYIQVEDCFAALKKLAAYYRGICQTKIVGITGSVGKTTTKEMIFSVLSQKYYTMKTLGNFNNEIGMPLTLLRMEQQDEMAVVEMGISDFGEMHRLGEIARPDACVITNIGQCHLENLGDRDGVLKAKTEVIAHLQPGAPVFLNGDDDKLITLKDNGAIEHQRIYYGMSDTFSVHPENIQYLGLEGIKFTMITPKGNFTVMVHAPGRHMIYNAMCAACVGLYYQLSLEQIKAGIEAFRPIGGRSNVIRTKNFTIMDDCYNANPVSMKAGIDVLSQVDNRKVAILGDMFELGENEKEMHFDTGVYCAKAKIDVLICIGQLAEYMAKGAESANEKNIHTVCTAQDGMFESVESGIQIYTYPDVEKACDSCMELLKKGDSIMVKASHGMHLERVVACLRDKDGE